MKLYAKETLNENGIEFEINNNNFKTFRKSAKKIKIIFEMNKFIHNFIF